MLPKIDELAALCSAENPDVVCLVETWLGHDITDNEVLVPNYSIVRLDRNRHGGGVAMYIHNSVGYNVLLCGPAGLELLVVALFRNRFKLCSIDPHHPHLLFLILFVTLCFLYTIPIFLIL